MIRPGLTMSDVEASVARHLPTAMEMVDWLKGSLGALEVPSDAAIRGAYLHRVLAGHHEVTGEVVRPEYLGGDWKVYAAFEHCLLEALDPENGRHLEETRSGLSAIVDKMRAAEEAAEAAEAKRFADAAAYVVELCKTRTDLFR